MERFFAVSFGVAAFSGDALFGVAGIPRGISIGAVGFSADILFVLTNSFRLSEGLQTWKGVVEGQDGRGWWHRGVVGEEKRGRRIDAFVYTTLKKIERELFDLYSSVFSAICPAKLLPRNYHPPSTFPDFNVHDLDSTVHGRVHVQESPPTIPNVVAAQASRDSSTGCSCFISCSSSLSSDL